MTEQATLDIEAIIRKAKLRSSREPQSVIASILCQTLQARGHDASLEFKLIHDPGRSTDEQLFAIRYQDELWTINGKGDWSQQLTWALARTSQTWKNPQLLALHNSIEAAIAQATVNTEYPLQGKLRARIELAVAELQGRAIETKTQPTSETVAPRKSPRL